MNAAPASATPCRCRALRRDQGRGAAAGRTVAAGLALCLASTAHAQAAVTRHAAAGPRDGVVAGTTEDGLRRYTFLPGAHPRLRIDLPDVPATGALRLPLQNAMPWAVTLTLDLRGAGAAALRATAGLPAGPPLTLLLPLHPTAPRAFGMQAGPPMPFDGADGPRFVVTAVEGRAPAGAGALALGIPSPAAPQVLRLGRAAYVADDGLHAAYAGIVDSLGQFTRGHWPEKVADVAALRAAQARERGALARVAPTAGRDRYGGSTAVRWRASGWFHAEKHAGRWSLVTPEGHPFFSLGVDAVSPDGGRTYVDGRAWMFRDLPAADGPLGRFYGRGDSRAATGATRGRAFDHGRWFDFYAADLYRVDGAGWRAAWRARTRARLRAWGFNTLGDWSDAALARDHGLVYTRAIEVRGTYADVATGYDYWGRMPDPFDPRFAAAVAAAVARASAGVREDPWLLGYFVDNELAWAGPGPQGRWALALGTLRGRPDSPAKRAWIAALRREYPSAAALGRAWGVALADWATLSREGFQAPLPAEAHPAIAADYRAWLRRYAEAYFRTVASTLHRADPHHLLLGGRFAVRTPEAVAACARWCAVISINAYADLPQHALDLPALRTLDRPVLLSEFAFGSADRGPFGTGPVAVWTEARRGEAYARYLRAAADTPVIVGAHWFQYLDEPVTGRLLDGENAHLGLVGVTDLPFAGFVRSVREANAAVRRRRDADWTGTAAPVPGRPAAAAPTPAPAAGR